MWDGAEIRRFAERWLGLTGSGDFVRSPAGLWLALGVVAAGAKGETADELRRLLGFAGDDAAKAVGEAERVLRGTEALGVASCVWSRVPVHREFQEALPGVAVGRLDPAEIDDWVRAVTGGLVERLPVRLGDDILLAVVNALALKARWEVPFEPWATRECDFMDAAGTRHRVPTMHKGVPLADAWTVGPTRVVELRCRAEQGGAPARVRFLLGAESAGPRDVLPAGWAGPGDRVPLDTDLVALALPRLSLRTTVEVTGHLAAWGIHRATTESADFSGMSPEPLAVSRVVQEAVLKVAEEGVEAAAVSVVPMAAGAAPPPLRTETIRFERPFGVVVLDASGEVPLFNAWQEGVPNG
ncbi:serpin family protein [Streptomyces sp. NPDC021093]|uniref:serpin family protein n=1 Tax=Streptomyces sp. NPDC021093 TaxID=3365112 RepID=UPI003791FB00